MITKDEVFSILVDWNLWENDQETGVPREEYLTKLKEYLKSGQIISIIGVRRAGKSTIMKQCMKMLVQSGVPRSDILYVNFEDPRFEGELDLTLLTKIYESYLENIKPGKKPYIFLDEVQEVKGWEKFVTSLHERNAANLIVSGSSSSLLSSEFSTLLTGRHLNLEVFPLSFSEYLSFMGLNSKDKLTITVNRIKINGLLKEYMEKGGFPLVVLTRNPQLNVDYFRDVVFRDVVRRYKIREVDKLQALVKYYLTNISSQITFNSIRKFLGLSIETIDRFSYYLKDAYLVFFLKRFSYSMKEQEKSPKKVYAIDNGLRNVVASRFSKDEGRIAENAVFLHLLRKQNELFYWKDKEQKEVDFIVKEGLKPKHAIQVCWSFESEKAKKREVGALVKAAKELKLEEGLVVTSEYASSEEIDGIKIKYVDLSSFLLDLY
jgi:predicted AAA+ superfamily ATPase